MLRSVFAAALCALVACSPTYNWREVPVEPTALKAQLPCQPDKGSRKVPMLGRDVELHAVGCEAGGATFAVMAADIGDPLRVGQALAQWNAASLANLHGTAGPQRPFLPPGAMAVPESQRLSVSGQRADGSKVQGETAYFARGSQVFQAVIYADQVAPEAAQAFFSGLKFE